MGNSVESREIEVSEPGELSILIISNNDDARILEQEAEFMGHMSQAVSSYKDALEKTREESFDLIIMDMDLSEGEWFNTVLKIRKVLGNIHIITMTENNSRKIEELARDQRVIYYIVKPLDMKEMRSVIDHISKKSAITLKIQTA